MPWQPRPGVCELVNLEDALMQPLRDVAAWVRQRYVEAPCGSEDPAVVATVRALRGQVFDRLLERLTP